MVSNFCGSSFGGVQAMVSCGNEHAELKWSKTIKELWIDTFSKPRNKQIKLTYTTDYERVDFLQ